MTLPDIINVHEAVLLLTAKFWKGGVKDIDPHHLLNDVTRHDALERRGYWMPKSQTIGGKIWFLKAHVEELAGLVIANRIKRKARKPSRRPTLAELLFTEPPSAFTDLIPAMMR